MVLRRRARTSREVRRDRLSAFGIRSDIECLLLEAASGKHAERTQRTLNVLIFPLRVILFVFSY